VVITGRTESTLQAAAAQHGNISYVVADIARGEDSSRVIADVSARCGRFDVPVNNAGMCEVMPLAKLDADHWRVTSARCARCSVTLCFAASNEALVRSHS
jgi:NADP-dependent 3-hydroxy acid dehydrogenase YdfG